MTHNRYAHGSNTYPRIGTLGAARYLLATKPVTELNITLTGDIPVQDYLAHLTNDKNWTEYKTHIQTEIEKTKKELADFNHADVVDLQHPGDPQSRAQSRVEAYETIATYLKNLEAQEKSTQQIDSLIHNGDLQELLTAQDELAARHSDYTDLAKQIKENRQKYSEIALQRDQAYLTDDDVLKDRLKDELINLSIEHDAIKNKMRIMANQDKDLRELITTIALLSPPKSAPAPAHTPDNAELHERIENIAETTETVAEAATSIDEIINSSLEYVERLHEMENVTEAGQHAETAASISPATEFLHAVPLVNNFIRGLNYLREAYDAYQDPHMPQRKTKMAAGLFGGLVSIGAGIVGALLLAGAGLMATGAAIFAAPIVIAAVTVGVYSVSLYRDGYVLHQARKQVEKAKAEADMLESEIAKEKEMIISNHIRNIHGNQAGNIDKIQNIQILINEKRDKLHQALQQNPINHEMVELFRKEATELCRQRNEYIARTPEIHAHIIEKFNSDPRLARLSVQKTNLTNSVNRLRQARNEARKKVIISAVCLVGVSLLLGAVCATGIGALVIGAIAATTLIVASAARLYISYKEKQSHAAAHQSAQQTSTDAHQHTHSHSSELTIDHALLHGRQHDIARALVNQTISQPAKSPQQAASAGEQQQHVEASNRPAEKQDESDGQRNSTPTLKM